MRITKVNWIFKMASFVFSIYSKNMKWYWFTVLSQYNNTIGKQLTDNLLDLRILKTRRTGEYNKMHFSIHGISKKSSSYFERLFFVLLIHSELINNNLNEWLGTTDRPAYKMCEVIKPVPENFWRLYFGSDIFLIETNKSEKLVLVVFFLLWIIKIDKILISVVLCDIWI